jgi:hypothetical protein
MSPEKHQDKRQDSHPTMPQDASDLDPESQSLLADMVKQDLVKNRRIAGVRTVLVVLSSKGMVYDVHALRHEVRMAYPDAAVFILTTEGKSIGAQAPSYVDLLIDFTGPGQRQGWFYARKLRRRARVAVGRNAGLFRKKIYDHVIDEKTISQMPSEVLDRERMIQKQVLALAGVAFVATGETHPDRGKTIALGLPPMQRL